MPAAHAAVSTELRVGPFSERVFPDFRRGESGLLGDSFGAKELVMQSLPTTRVAVEGNLSAGTLRAVAQTDYFRAEYDSTGTSDWYTNAGARVNMSDWVTFNNVAIGQVGHLDLVVTGGFSTDPGMRIIPRGIAWAAAGVSSADQRVSLVRQAWFAADAGSVLMIPRDIRERHGSNVGSSVSYFDTLSFDLRPGRYHFFWQLELVVQGLDADFSSTARTYLRLPEGVTYTSESGVFLATATPLLPVPEPPMLHQALLGLGVLAGWLRFRNLNAPRKRIDSRAQLLLRE